MCRRSCFLSLLAIVFLLLLNGPTFTNQQVQFPHTLVSKTFSTVLLGSAPNFGIKVGEVSILEFDVVQIREIHYPADLHVYNNSEEFNENVKTTGHTLQTIDIDDNFLTQLADTYNHDGINFTTTLSNGATLTISYSTNHDEDIELEIPKTPTNQNCSESLEDPDMSGPLGNCSCEENHLLPKNESLKFTVEVANWSFQPLYPNMTDRYLVFTINGSGPFNMRYYFSSDFDFGKAYNRHEVCELGTIYMNMSGGDYIIPFTLLSNGYYDGVVNNISATIDLPNATPLDSNPDIILIPFYFLFHDFNHTLYYDPDITVLLMGGDGSSSTDGNEGASGFGDGSSAGTSKGWMIAVGVTCGAVVLFILVAVGVLFVMVYLKRKKLAGIISRSSELQNSDSNI